MTLHWRALPDGAVDHELLWTSVMAAAGIAAAMVIYVAGLPVLGCPFKAVTGLPCVTCGFTRGMLALAAGDLLTAARWNPLVPLGAAAAAAYLAYAAAALAAGPRRLRASFSASEGQLARWGTVAIAAMVWGWLIVDGR